MNAITANSVDLSLDFGSSRTSVSWGKTLEKVTRPIRNWEAAKNTPFSAGSELPEVPTTVASKDGRYRFGYACQNLKSNLRSSWTIVRNLKASIPKANRGDQDALVQYLGFIRKHAFEQIAKELPAFDIVQFVVTCPANFGDDDQQYLTTCLRLAGWPTTKLIFMWEVEAVMESYAKERREQLHGTVTTFSVIDAGGGTCVSSNQGSIRQTNSNAHRTSVSTNWTTEIQTVPSSESVIRRKLNMAGAP